jgi:cytochrome c-type biogenesis protein CcmH
MALKFIPAEHADLSQQISAAADDARQRAGLPPTAKSTEPAPSPTAAPAQVVGTVSLSTQLAQQARPEDTVFIVARPAQGPRMPLAVLRKQVKDLPLQFTLDDSLAMSPQMKLSAYSQVVVGARVSKSGQAMPQAGDLEGWSKPVNVGTTGIKIDIKDVVR